VAQAIGFDAFKEAALRAYAHALERRRRIGKRNALAKASRGYPPSRGVLIEQGVLPRREDTQCPLHLDRPHAE
jgi:hypothetical protein